MEKREQSESFAYMPVKPDGDWWIGGCDKTLPAAQSAVSSLEGCVAWQECYEIGWRIVLVQITLRPTR